MGQISSMQATTDFIGGNMKGQAHLIRRPKLKSPETTIVEVAPQVNFVYIVRMDSEFAVNPLAQKMSTGYALDEKEAKSNLLEAYEIFFSELADAFAEGFSHRGNFELHLYDPHELDAQVRQRAGSSPIVSLDPLVSQGVYSMKVSRAYYLGGKSDTGQIARPGNAGLNVQAEQIAKWVAGEPVCVLEDDVFTGGSITASLDELTKHGITILKVIPGIQVGSPDKLTKSGIIVDPVVRYRTTDGTDVFDKVDLGDPRDYLIGASGLVVHLPNGEYGRAPYLLPFVSTSARSSIPPQAERAFALNVLQANIEFFREIERIAGKPLLLCHMDGHFGCMMQRLYGFDPSTSMLQIVTWAKENIDAIWEITQRLGEVQQLLDTMLSDARNLSAELVKK
jgi:hypothetical protein